MFVNLFLSEHCGHGEKKEKCRRDFRAEFFAGMDFYRLGDRIGLSINPWRKNWKRLNLGGKLKLKNHEEDYLFWCWRNAHQG